MYPYGRHATSSVSSTASSSRLNKQLLPGQPVRVPPGENIVRCALLVEGRGGEQYRALLQTRRGYLMMSSENGRPN